MDNNNRQSDINLLRLIYSLLVPKVVDVTFVTSTTTGTIKEGTTSITVTNGSSAGTVTCNGTTYTLAANEKITLDPGFGRKNGKITYDGTGTSLKFIIYR